MPAYIQAIYTIGTRHNLLIIFCILLLLSCSTSSFAVQNEPAILSAPVLSSEFYPCSKCHKHDTEEEKVGREAFHVTIPVMGHIEETYGCFACHDSENLDKLRLFTGSKIDLAVSSELCGQCHSTNYKLWQTGLHGKVVGYWNGSKEITPCTTCHDPHQPRYRIQKPEPPPTHPEQTLRWRK